MDVKLLKQTIKYIIKANEEKNINLIPCIWGKTGIGKTEVTKQVLKEMGYKMEYVTTGNMEDVGDLLGLPKINKNGVTEFSQPDWWPKSKKTVIFLDEINRSKPQIRQALFPLLNQKRILNHFLPPQCHIIAAANPSTEEYETIPIYDHALLSRFVHLEFLPELNEWIKFTLKLGGDSEVVSFFDKHNEFLTTKVNGFDLSELVKPDRRKATQFALFASTNPPEEVLKYVGYGMLGFEATQSFIKFKHSQKINISGQKMLYNLTEKDIYQLKKFKSNPSVLYKVTMEILNEIEKMPPSKKKLSGNTFNNLVQIIKYLPFDIILNFIYDLQEVLPHATFLKIISHEELTQFLDQKKKSLQKAMLTNKK